MRAQHTRAVCAHPLLLASPLPTTLFPTSKKLKLLEYPQGRAQPYYIDVREDGRVDWRVEVRADLITTLDVTAFPFDSQTLDVVINRCVSIFVCVGVFIALVSRPRTPRAPAWMGDTAPSSVWRTHTPLSLPLTPTPPAPLPPPPPPPTHTTSLQLSGHAQSEDHPVGARHGHSSRLGAATTCPGGTWTASTCLSTRPRPYRPHLRRSG